MRCIMIFSLLCIIASPVLAVEVHKGQGTPAPTQPVSSNNIPAPVFQSDTRNLENILDTEETAKVVHVVPAIKMKPALPAPTINLQPIAASQPIITESENTGILSTAIIGIRVFSIRWREMFDIFFSAILVIYVRKLYILSREQNKILSHCIRSAEYSAAAAKRAVDICEILLQDQEKKPDAAQGLLDL